MRKRNPSFATRNLSVGCDNTALITQCGLEMISLKDIYLGAACRLRTLREVRLVPRRHALSSDKVVLDCSSSVTVFCFIGSFFSESASAKLGAGECATKYRG